MIFRVMENTDIEKVVPFYMDYYNTYDNSCWTKDSTYKRIHQVWSREDSYCLLLEEEDKLIGFAMGYFEQYDDLQAYDLVEILLSHDCKNIGIGTRFMLELERRVKEKGAAMIQLQSLNDEMHEHFYGKLQYKNTNNLVLKTKWL